MQVLLKVAVWLGVVSVTWIIDSWSVQAGIVGIVIGSYVIAHGLRAGLDRS